ncbi:hypothetical protein [Pedobacter heparinus]|uniref:Uncharacterized protein n=1 Tax=Pedobacter heparinus (strain ATCC 13125 / DSM 2366 / CIP 104194 / JCM 7457 / NBRC 12017 / NCIMB 9290 / NRRL B-14731 / HIM 762-3) TaxID=485917 RepID=C6XVF1_PEDHD|nr:hypothetical protein [Pedobacter heparinus]ACU04017.1 hypothetical protein Phep_1808 [Pedobacter heparinus DSM 2366]
MKKRIYTLLFCALGSVLLVMGMAYISNPDHHIGSGFIREIPSHKIEGIGFVPVMGKLHYLAGGDSTQVFLGNWAKPTELLKISLPGKEADTVQMLLKDWSGLLEGIYLSLHQGTAYLMDGLSGTYFKADTGIAVFGRRNRLPYFSAVVPLGRDIFILRVVQDSLINSLVKQAPGATDKPLVLDGRANSMFATDGTLCATPDGSKIFYSYHYKNQFLCLDSNLKVLYTGKTIDTCSVAQVKVARVESDKSLRMAAPPRRVNLKAAVNEEWLFVQSAIKAENETEESLKGLATVDVYKVGNGKYQFSLYIPDFKDQKLRDFRVYGKYFVGLYKECVYIYRLNF